ncbi:MAG: diphosphomevalonate decarboxylase [Candidatus Bathyarchaeota archaeon]|nr:diphosphomevalonate decarboxylase [Candidatus Bathyarchaeota archaeon]
MKASAIAHSNIALIKYWGRSRDHDPDLNIPSNDSVSMTKYGLAHDVHLQTHTTIDFSDSYEEDTANLDGAVLVGRNMDRILRVVDPLREYARVDSKFRMMSRNDFPTQAGLASSSSGFAALAIATINALGIDFTKEEISKYARLGSGSAARSIHGGFVYWNNGSSHETSFAQQICGPNEFGMNAVIAIVHEGKKEVTSDVGHNLAHTSPFDAVRIQKSDEQAKDIRKAILDHDFTEVGEIAEENCKYMHAVMMTSTPPLFYWTPETLRLIRSTQAMRKEGLECYFTIDAGPNVHYFCRPEDTYELQKILEKIEGVSKTILAKPARDSQAVKKHLF